MKSKKCKTCKRMLYPTSERVFNHLGTFCDFKCLDGFSNPLLT